VLLSWPLVCRAEQYRIDDICLAIASPSERIKVARSTVFNSLVQSHDCCIHVARHLGLTVLPQRAVVRLDRTLIWLAKVEVLEVLLPIAWISMAGPM
jgi:hypothetical protein